MYSKIKRYYENIINYFPEYSENPDYLPQRDFYGIYYAGKFGSKNSPE